MTAQRGKDILLKIEDTESISGFITIGGLRAKSISLNTQTVDITHAESNAWRELLGGAGVRQASISGAGIFLDDEASEIVRQIFFNGDIRKWRLLLPDFGIIEGAFQLTNLDFAGDYSGEVTMSLALESAGILSFEALS